MVTAAIALCVRKEIHEAVFANEGGRLCYPCTRKGREQQSWRRTSSVFLSENGFWMTRGFLVKKPVGDILLWSERGSGLAGCVTEDGCPSRVDVVFRSSCREVWSRRIFWKEESHRQEYQGQEKSCRRMILSLDFSTGFPTTTGEF